MCVFSFATYRWRQIDQLERRNEKFEMLENTLYPCLHVLLEILLYTITLIPKPQQGGDVFNWIGVSFTKA